MPLREFLIELSEAFGVSGHEEPVQRIVRREMSMYCDEVFVTKLGSVVGVRRSKASQKRSRRRGSEGAAPKLMLEGHMDEIGLVVTSVDQGYIRFSQIGGYDVRVLPSQNVIVHGREELAGVVGSRPPHVLSMEERDKSTPMPELFIDVGLSDGRVRELVTVGDIITLDRKVTTLRNDRLAGKGFDDRAAVAVLVDCMRRLQESPLSWDVYAVANVQEEDGAWYAGATTSAFQIQPDAAIALDVSHADQPGISDVNMVPLDKGPGIARGPNIHPLIHDKLVQSAKAEEIPHRITTYAGPTGTDAWAIQIVGEGIPTGLLDIPLRYMHTPVEMLALSDLERTARLLASFATGLDDEFCVALKGQTSATPRTRKEGAKRAKKKAKGR